MDKEQNLKAFLRQLVPMSEKNWIFFREHLHSIEFTKKDVITRFGEIENRLCFLIEGIVRFVIKAVNELTSDFAFPGDFFSSYSSFLSRTGSTYEIIPVTAKVQCYFITYDSLQEIYQNTQCGEKIGCLAAEQQFLRKSAREVSLLSLSFRERYLQLLREKIRDSRDLISYLSALSLSSGASRSSPEAERYRSSSDRIKS